MQAIDAGIRPGALQDSLDALCAHVGASRWVLAWEVAGQWLTLGLPHSRDDLIVELAASHPDVAECVDPHELGDAGRRLAATGIARLTCVSWPGESALLVFEDPMAALPPHLPSGSWIIGLLTAERAVSDLLAFQKWTRSLGAVASGELGLGPALARLGEAFEADVVAVVRPAARAVSLCASHRDGRGWRASDDVHDGIDWDDVVRNPSTILRPAITELAGHFGSGLVAGHDAEHRLVLLLGDPRSARFLTDDLDLVAVLLGQALKTAGDVAGSRERTRMVERTRMASVLHEELSQRLANISVRLELLTHKEPAAPVRQDLASLRGDVVDALDALRSAIYELTPPEPTWLHLVSGLTRFVEDHARQRGIAATLDVSGSPRPVEPEAVSLLFATVQEGITNVAKHAGVDRADVYLTFAPEEVTVEVCDDGPGIDPAALESVSGHQGLAVLRTRARLAGSSLEIETCNGTRLQLRVPLTVDLREELEDVYD